MNERLKADLALAFCSFIWGTTFVVGKQALDDASVLGYMVVRFGLATVVLALMYRRALRQFRRSDLWPGVLIGLVLFTGFILQTAGLKFTTPSKAGFVTGLNVVLVPILLAGFARRRIGAWVWMGVGAAIAGLYFLTVPAGAAGLNDLNEGDVLVLGCALLFALHVIFVGRYTAHHSVAALTLVQVTTTAVLTSISVPLAAGTGWEPLRIAWTPRFIFAIAVTAIGATAVAFSVQVWAQRHTTPTHTALILSLEPVFAALTSYVVIGERLGVRGIVGAGLILAGILLAELKGAAPVLPEASLAADEVHPRK